jgi:nitrogen fixation/metabolism regulation signal transduction histidine kinase
MGLGLAITRTIVEAHGGSIAVARCTPRHRSIDPAAAGAAMTAPPLVYTTTL